LVEFAGEVEHHVPAESTLLAQDAKHGSDAVIGGIRAGILACRDLLSDLGLEYTDPGRVVRYLLERGDEVSSKLSSRVCVM